MKYISADDFRDGGYLQEANRCFFHPLGLALELKMPDGTMSVQDHRADPEGVIFADGVIDGDKARKVWDEKADRGDKRQNLLGYRIQPMPA